MLELLHPIFFYVGGAVAAVVPLILHLIQARRTVRLPFSTIRFLLLAQRQSSHRVRMENLLLWILRTLLLACLALAFAMPMLRNKAFGTWLGRASRDVAIVIDGSYSMAYSVGRGTVWDRAVEQAVSIVEGLSEQDRFCVFVARDRVEPVIEQLSGDREEAVRRIKALAFSETPSQLAPAVADANASLMEAQERRERELHVITDGQALPWASFGEGGETEPQEKLSADGKEPIAASMGAWDPRKADERMTSFVSLLGAEAPENMAPVGVEIDPPLIMAGAPAKVTVRLGYTGEAGGTAVSLLVDGREVGSRSVTIGEGAATDLTFMVPPLARGRHAARIEIPDDNLSIDNAFHFLIRAEDRVPTLCVGSKDDAFFLNAALSAGLGGKATIAAESIEPRDLGGEKLDAYSCVLLCNAVPLAADEMVAVEGFVEAGGLLVLFPGDRATPQDYRAWKCLPGVPSAVIEVPMNKRKQILHWEAPHHPVLEDLKTESAPPEVTVFRQLAWEEPLPKDVVRLVSHAGERPFLLGRPFGRGYVLMFAVPADRSWSDFPLSPYYLPIVHQIVRFGAGVGANTHFVWCTPTLPLEPYLPEATIDSALQGPDGTTLPVRSAVTEGRVFLNVERLEKAGIYRMTLPGGAEPEPALAVNMERSESDLTPIDPGAVKSRLGLKKVHVVRDRQELLDSIEESRVGRTFGEHLLWLALLLAAIEFIYANRLMKKEPTLSEKLQVEESGRVPAGGEGG
jgi:hypothetical protein